MLLGFTSSTILSTFRTGWREHIASSLFDKKIPLRDRRLYTALAPAFHFHGAMYVRFRLMYSRRFVIATAECPLGSRDCCEICDHSYNSFPLARATSPSPSCCIARSRPRKAALKI